MATKKTPENMSSAHAITMGLSAALLTVEEAAPKVLVVNDGLPFGAFDPEKDFTLHLGLHRWIKEQTGLTPNYVEQLYTFGNRFRDPGELAGGPRVVSIGYLGLLPPTHPHSADATWEPVYDYLPWEDQRKENKTIVEKYLVPALNLWANEAPTPKEITRRKQRLALNWGPFATKDPATPFDNERVLERYQMLYEAGLLEEAQRDFKTLRGKTTNLPMSDRVGRLTDLQRIAKMTGKPMPLDHRRILASALQRIRGKLKYRPLVFEIMPQTFTLFELQKVVEALSGTKLHKQNFRRLVQTEGLVQETGKFDTSGRGRPAELYKFREEVLYERPAPGLS